jgi:uncharacterized protein (TIGR03083 family)
MSKTQSLSASAEKAALLLPVLRESQVDILTLLTSLSPHDLALPTFCPGWSVRDQVGHLIDITEKLVRGLEEAATGQTEGVFQPANMAAATQESAIERAALLPLAQLKHDFEEASGQLLSLLEKRDPQSWDDPVGHPYLGSCPAVQFAGFALQDWFIHPFDIRTALDQNPVPRADQAALLAVGLVGMLPKRLNLTRSRNMRGRFRFIIEKPGSPAKAATRLDVVLAKNAVTIEPNVGDEVPVELTFKGKASDVALSMLGRRGISKIVQPGANNDTWMARWTHLWISL